MFLSRACDGVRDVLATFYGRYYWALRSNIVQTVVSGIIALYAADALARWIFPKGPFLVTAIVFGLAARNPDVELGIISSNLLASQFTLAEFIGASSYESACGTLATPEGSSF